MSSGNDVIRQGYKKLDGANDPRQLGRELGGIVEEVNSMKDALAQQMKVLTEELSCIQGELLKVKGEHINSIAQVQGLLDTAPLGSSAETGDEKETGTATARKRHDMGSVEKGAITTAVSRSATESSDKFLDADAYPDATPSRSPSHIVRQRKREDDDACNTSHVDTPSQPDAVRKRRRVSNDAERKDKSPEQLHRDKPLQQRIEEFKELQRWRQREQFRSSGGKWALSKRKNTTGMIVSKLISILVAVAILVVAAYSAIEKLKVSLA